LAKEFLDSDPEAKAATAEGGLLLSGSERNAKMEERRWIKQSSF
jgi:hypothetical protein